MPIWKRVFILSDIQGRFVDHAALKKCLKDKEDFKPHINICNGDAIDFTGLRKGASQEEASLSIEEEIRLFKVHMDQFRPTHLNFGNHEDRLFQMLNSGDAVRKEFSRLTLKKITNYLDKIKCTWLPYDSCKGIYDLNGVRILHGYKHGLSAARETAKIYDKAIMGHIHFSSTINVDGWPSPKYCLTSGCLCNWDAMDYTRRSTGKLRWNHGWIKGIINQRTGSSHYWHVVVDKETGKVLGS